MKTIILVPLTILPLSLHAVTVDKVLQEIDKRMSQVSDFSAKVALTQQKVGQGVKNFETLFFRRDEGDEFLMVTTAPPSPSADSSDEATNPPAAAAAQQKYPRGRRSSPRRRGLRACPGTGRA